MLGRGEQKLKKYFSGQVLFSKQLSSVGINLLNEANHFCLRDSKTFSILLSFLPPSLVPRSKDVQSQNSKFHLCDVLKRGLLDSRDGRLLDALAQDLQTLVLTHHLLLLLGRQPQPFGLPSLEPLQNFGLVFVSLLLTEISNRS